MSRTLDLNPSLGDLLGWSKDGKLPPGLEMSREASARLDADARRMAAFAETSDGQWLIDLLMELTVRRSPIDLGQSGEDAREYAARRFGQNQVVAAIAFYLNHAAELEQQDHDRPREPDPDPVPYPGGWNPGGRSGRTDRDAGGDGPGFDPAGTVALR